MLKTWKKELKNKKELSRQEIRSQSGPAPSEAAIQEREEWANTAAGKIEFNKYTMCKKNI